jgi:hypothetical protein
MTHEKKLVLLRMLCIVIAVNLAVILLIPTAPRLHLTLWILSVISAVVILVVWWRAEFSRLS